MTTRKMLVLSALVLLPFLSNSCREGKLMVLVGEVYYPVYGNPSTTRVLVRAPVDSITTIEPGSLVDVGLLMHPGDPDILAIAARGDDWQFVLRMQVLGISDDGSEVWLKIPSPGCSSSSQSGLEYEPGKTKLVNVICRVATGRRVEARRCEAREVIRGEPIRIK